jgi:hypothetical protein
MNISVQSIEKQDAKNKTRKTYEVRNGEELGARVARSGPVNVKVPVVRQLQAQTGVVAGLDDNDVGAKVGTQEHAEAADDVGTLRLGPGKVDLSELLLRRLFLTNAIMSVHRKR